MNGALACIANDTRESACHHRYSWRQVGPLVGRPLPAMAYGQAPVQPRCVSSVFNLLRYIFGMMLIQLVGLDAFLLVVRSALCFRISGRAQCCKHTLHYNPRCPTSSVALLYALCGSPGHYSVLYMLCLGYITISRICIPCRFVL